MPGTTAPRPGEEGPGRVHVEGVGGLRIEVTGHTDTSGSPQYNQGLSVRRANAVAAGLVRLGVPRNEITARGVGESQLLVSTPDNTREPQNRRVEIVLR